MSRLQRYRGLGARQEAPRSPTLRLPETDYSAMCAMHWRDRDRNMHRSAIIVTSAQQDASDETQFSKDLLARLPTPMFGASVQRPP